MDISDILLDTQRMAGVTVEWVPGVLTYLYSRSGYVLKVYSPDFDIDIIRLDAHDYLMKRKERKNKNARHSF